MKTETGPERRRSTDENAQVVGEAMVPGAPVAEIAWRRGVSRGLIYTWRREASHGVSDAVVAVEPPVCDSSASV